MNNRFDEPRDDTQETQVEERLETLLRHASPRTPDSAKLNALYLEAKKESLRRRRPTFFKKIAGYAVALALAVVVLWRLDAPPPETGPVATVDKADEGVAIELLNINDPKAIRAMVSADGWIEALNALNDDERSRMLAGLETAMDSPEEIREQQFWEDLVQISSDELFEEPEFW